LPVGGCTLAGAGSNGAPQAAIFKCSFVYSGADAITVVPQLNEAGWADSSYRINGFIAKPNTSPLAGCGFSRQAAGLYVDYADEWIYGPALDGCVSMAAIANGRSEPSLCVNEHSGCSGSGQVAPKPGDVLVCVGSGGAQGVFSYTITCKG
jgi:hypothetical protein